MNRRRFINAVAAASAPLIVPSHVLGRPGRPGANDRIQIGFIGAGGRGKWLMSYFGNEITDAEIVAVCDCYLPRCYGTDGTAAKPLPDGALKATKYQNYRKMFEKEKLDAVFVETTTHARVLIAMHAMQAGLDVYAEKPVSLTVSEGRTLVNAVRKYKKVLQVGSQQRSMPINRYASEMVRNGKIGKINSVIVCNYMPGREWKPQPEQPVPEMMDWDAWCNQTELRPYHPTLQRGWGDWVDYDGGGQSWGVSGWGTHGLDQVQCALGTDGTGPVEMWTEDRKIEDEADFPLARNAVWKPFLGRKPVMLRYDSGTVLKLEEGGKNSHSQLGGIFVGSQGTIQILRGNYVAGPAGVKAEADKDAPPATLEGKGEDTFHLRNFLDCLRTREKPNADVETAHRATTVCHLVNICRKLDRKLKWDPIEERFLNDEEANGMLSRPRRKGYELPKV
jgi:predicted dehydrogenase